MFPNFSIVLVYAQADAKVRDNLQFGIAPYCEEQLMLRDVLLPSSSMRATVDLSTNSMMNVFNIG